MQAAPGKGKSNALLYGSEVPLGEEFLELTESQKDTNEQECMEDRNQHGG